MEGELWLRDRYCYECGSGLIVWMYRQPHCFNCGANYPYKGMDNDCSSEGLVKVEGVWKEQGGVEYCGEDEWYHIEETRIKTR